MLEFRSKIISATLIVTGLVAFQESIFPATELLVPIVSVPDPDSELILPKKAMYFGFQAPFITGAVPLTKSACPTVAVPSVPGPPVPVDAGVGTPVGLQLVAVSTSFVFPSHVDSARRCVIAPKTTAIEKKNLLKHRIIYSLQTT